MSSAGNRAGMATYGDFVSTPAASRLRGPDRRQRRRFVVRERRSGFDRRRGHRSGLAAAFERPLLRLRNDPILLLELLVLVNLFSALDLALTLLALEMGAVELNPLMDHLLGIGVAPAAAVKVGIVLLATTGLWLLRRYRVALMTAVLIFAIYASLIVFELVGIMRIA